MALYLVLPPPRSDNLPWPDLPAFRSSFLSTREQVRSEGAALFSVVIKDLSRAWSDNCSLQLSYNLSSCPSHSRSKAKPPLSPVQAQVSRASSVLPCFKKGSTKLTFSKELTWRLPRYYLQMAAMFSSQILPCAPRLKS